jgi:hypothetical protein
MRVGSIGALAAAAALTWACKGGGSPTTPTAATFTGSYSFAIDASSVCRLPVSRYEWEVQVTSNTAGGGGKSGSSSTAVRATLPGGDNTVDVSLQVGASQTGGSLNATGNITVRQSGFGNDPLRVTVSGSATGAVTTNAGRGQIESGTINTTITLLGPPAATPDPRPGSPTPPPTQLGTCTAADHKWSLLPR